MRRKKELRQDLKIMHRFYEDLLGEYHEQKKRADDLEQEKTRLENLVRVFADDTYRCREVITELDDKTRNFEKFLTGEGVHCAPDFSFAPQAWGIHYAVSAEQLDMRSSDSVSLDWNHAMHAYEFRAMVVGERQDLVRTLDRLIWTLQHVRAKAAKDPE